MANYKIKLTEIQLRNICFITDNKEKQSKIMSILSYLMKYTNSETMELTKSLNRLFIMYSVNNWKYHNKIARSYFYEIANLILKNNYFLTPIQDNKVDTLSDKINTVQSIENTSIKNDFKKTNVFNNNTYTYTPYTVETVKATELVDDVFKELNIKSKIIKTMVLAKIDGVVLDIKGAATYLFKVVIEKVKQYNQMKVKYAVAVAQTKYSKEKNRYIAPVQSYSHYDYDSLEKKLLNY